MNNDAAVTVMQVLMSRCSIRASLPDVVDVVDQTTLQRIFDHARRAPSGSNTQPWKAYVVTGEACDALSRKVLAVYNDPEADKLHEEEFAYCPRKSTSPFIDRRHELGWSLYSLLDIACEDRTRMQTQPGRNFEFFGVPVGVIFVNNRRMERGS